MTDQEIIDALRYLGIDNASYRVVALLPLVQVAWADGTIQRAERSFILATAQNNGMLVGDGARILKNWLTFAPTDDYVSQGRECLVALARRSNSSLGDAVMADTLGNILDLCETVARSAGGVFGLMWSVDARERTAIQEIAVALEVEVDESLGWDELTAEVHKDEA